MFVRTRGALLAAILTLGATSPLVAQKVGFVNTARVLQEMPQRPATEAAIRAALEALAARQQVMVDSLNGMVAGFERDSAALSQADKLVRFQQMQAYDVRYRDTLEVLEQQSQEVQAEAMQPLFDLIRTALDDIRAEENYTMILDLSRESSQIVTFDRNLDISDRVLTRIRAAAGARPGAAPGAARPPAATTSPTAPRPAQPGPVAQPSAARRP